MCSNVVFVADSIYLFDVISSTLLSCYLLSYLEIYTVIIVVILFKLSLKV